MEGAMACSKCQFIFIPAGLLHTPLNRKIWFIFSFAYLDLIVYLTNTIGKEKNTLIKEEGSEEKIPQQIRSCQRGWPDPDFMTGTILGERKGLKSKINSLKISSPQHLDKDLFPNILDSRCPTLKTLLLSNTPPRTSQTTWRKFDIINSLPKTCLAFRVNVKD